MKKLTLTIEFNPKNFEQYNYVVGSAFDTIEEKPELLGLKPYQVKAAKVFREQIKKAAIESIKNQRTD